MKRLKWEKWVDVLDSSNNEDKQRFIIHTPLGLISHKIREDAESSLNFWIGHTNFDIDKEVYEKIKDVEGVEILSLFTPYSFRVCIGKLFNEKKVMRSIASALGCVKLSGLNIDLKNKEMIVRTKNKISKNKHWCIYVLPNGSFEYFSTNIDEEFIDPINFYSNMEKDLGGLLLTSSNKIGV